MEIYTAVTGVSYTNNPLSVVSDFFFCKATKTLDAICVLCEAGFAEDALVLGRTLFELCVHLRTIASPLAVEQRQHKAQCFVYDGDRQRVKKLKEMAKLKQQGKCLSWITEIEALNPICETTAIPDGFVRPNNLKNMATDLGDPWECWYHFLYWCASHLTHPTGLGAYTYTQENDDSEEISRRARNSG